MKDVSSSALAPDLEQARRIAADYASAVRSHFGPRTRRVRLFGSAARGDWMTDSDIDVLVLLDRIGSSDVDWLVHTALSMGVLQSGILLQPVIMAEAEFRGLLDRERRFALEIMQEGAEL